MSVMVTTLTHVINFICFLSLANLACYVALRRGQCLLFEWTNLSIIGAAPIPSDQYRSSEAGKRDIPSDQYRSSEAGKHETADPY